MDNQLEKTSCALCGSDDYDVYLTQEDRRYNSTPRQVFNLVKCNVCRLIYLNPRPKKEHIGQYYPDAFYTFRTKNNSNKELSRAYLNNYEKSKILEKMKIIRKYLPRGKLLDVGCAAGEFMNSMKSLGWEVNGVEISSAMCDHVVNNYKIPCSNSELESVPESFADYDIITFWASLEHVYDPLETLKKAYSLLKPNGKLIILVPNGDSLEDKIFKSIDNNPIDIPRHLYHFTPKTLNAFVESAGYVPLKYYHHTKNAYDRLSIILISRLLWRVNGRIMKNIFLTLFIMTGNMLSKLFAIFSKSHSMILVAEKH